MTLGLAAYGYGQGWPIPHWHCIFQATLGRPGPGCGLTRAWIALVQGHIGQSFQFHLFGPVLALAAAGVALQAAIELLLGRPVAYAAPRRAWTARLDLIGGLHRHGQTLLPSLAIASLGYYGLRLYARYSSSHLALSLDTQPVWHWLKVGAQQL